MKFIQLTSRSHTKRVMHRVLASSIVCVSDANPAVTGGNTADVLVSGYTFGVKETPEQVMALINAPQHAQGGLALGITETALVLAGLRILQDLVLRDGRAPMSVAGILSDAGLYPSQQANLVNDIDSLCEKVNTA